MELRSIARYSSLCVLIATGCSGSDKEEREDASDPVLTDSGTALDADDAFDAGEPNDEEDAQTADAGESSEATVDDAGLADAEADASDLDAAPGEDAAPSEDATAVDDAGAGAGEDGGGDPASDASTTDDGSVGPGFDASPDDAGEDDASTGDAGTGGNDAARDDASDADASVCPGDNAGLSLPAGFCATRFAEGLVAPRHLVVTPAGDVFVASMPKSGASPSFVGLRDADRDGVAEQREPYGATPGNGVDWEDGYLYFGGNEKIVRYQLPNGALRPTDSGEVIVRDLPATPDHPAKTVLVHDGRLYVNIGSATNSCQEENRALESPGIDPCPDLELRSGVWVFDADTFEQTQAEGARFATGTRNANALAFDDDGRLFTAQNSRDQLYENWPAIFTPEDDLRLPAEGVFHLSDGDDYGWPYCYYDAQARQYFLAPEYGGDGETVGRCAGIEQPVTTLPAHWAPLGMVFYQGTQFPSHYRGGAFIANHGSRFSPDASEPLPGYNVVFVPFAAGGRAAGPFERFAEGFAGPGRPLPDNAQHRPVGVAVAPDGSLFVSDDHGGTVYRIVYRGP